MVDGVHRGEHGGQHLRGADVAGRLLPADVLFPRLQREPVRGLAVGVDGDADEAAGQLPAQLLADGDVAGVRAAEAQRQAEPLGGADPDVRAHLPRRPQQGEREQVGGDRGQRAALVRRLDGRGQVAHGTGRARVLQQHAEQGAVRLAGDRLRGDVGDDQVDAERFGPGTQHAQGLRQAVGVGEEHVAPAGRAARQRHRLRGRGRLVQQRRPGHGQRRQAGDHRLEVQQGLQPALGDFRLVRRVGGVPARVLQHVPADDRRGDGAVVAEPDHGGQHLVAPGEAAQFGERGRLGQGRGQAERCGAGRRGQGGPGELVQGGVPHGREHLALLVRGRPNVTPSEFHPGAS